MEQDFPTTIQSLLKYKIFLVPVKLSALNFSVSLIQFVNVILLKWLTFRLFSEFLQFAGIHLLCHYILLHLYYPSSSILNCKSFTVFSLTLPFICIKVDNDMENLKKMDGNCCFWSTIELEGNGRFCAAYQRIFM